MNERIQSIFEILLKNPEIRLTEIASKLNLSKRQVNYALNQFNEELEERGIPIVSRSHSGEISIPLEVIQLFANQTNRALDVPIYSENERSILILLLLVMNYEYVSLNHLIDFLMVSKNTVLDDVKRAEWLAQKYDLQIQYDRYKGYQLIGTEHKILQLLSNTVQQSRVSQREVIKEQLNLFVSEEEVVHFIHEVEQFLHLSYSDESLDYLNTSIQYLVTRGVKEDIQKKIFFENHVRQTPEFRIISSLILDTNWALSSSYIEWLSLLFLTSNVFEKKTTQIYDSDNALRKLIHEMVEKFQTQTFIMIEERENFERRILSHLRPACFRIQYDLSLGIQTLESLIQDSNHAILIELMKELILPIENWLGKAFPNDELELLSYYFGFQLGNSNGLSGKKARAVVVCSNGVMVSKLMRENLKKLFPELHFLASFSVRDFYQFEEDYTVVFTTIPLETGLPQYIINPIMSYEEQIHLRYRVLRELGLNEMDHSIDTLMKIIQRNTQINDKDKLKDELQYFLLTEKDSSLSEQFRVLPSLTYYLKPKYVKVVEKVANWQEALEIACQPLLEDQVVLEEFVQDCEKQIGQSEFYGFLGEKMAIPHTRPENGILKDGVSFLVLKEPVEFPNGQQINFIVPLAFYNLTRHLRAINQLANLSSQKDLIQQMISCGDATMVYQQIRKYT